MPTAENLEVMDNSVDIDALYEEKMKKMIKNKMEEAEEEGSSQFKMDGKNIKINYVKNDGDMPDKQMEKLQNQIDKITKIVLDFDPKGSVDELKLKIIKTCV